MLTKFEQDEILGKRAVKAFTDYLDEYNIEWRPATIEEQHQGIDIVADKKYEIKNQTYHSKMIIEEDNQSEGDGWIYSSKADVLVSVHLSNHIVSKNDIRMREFEMKKLRAYYDKTKHQHGKLKNKPTVGLYGDVWQSKYREYDIDELEENVQ